MKADHWQETDTHFIWWRVIPKAGLKSPFQGRVKNGPKPTDIDVMRSTQATFKMPDGESETVVYEDFFVEKGVS